MCVPATPYTDKKSEVVEHLC